MFPGAKVLVVDDENDELEQIVSTLRTLGIACVAYRYPDDLPDELPTFPGVRALFLDINLIGGGSPGSSAAILNAPLSMIGRLIGEQNGPYALITWSSTALHQQLMARVAQTTGLASKQPFYSCALAKADFAGDPPRLKAEIEKLFSVNAPFGSLLDWEGRVATAGERVLQQLSNLSAQFAGALPRHQMDELLSRLAVAAFGKSNADQHKFEAVNEALMPMLSDALTSEFFSSEPPPIWDEALTQCATLGPLNPAVAAALNSTVLVDAGAGLEPHRRGAILEVPTRWLSDTEFKRRFGATSSEMASSLNLGGSFSPKWLLVQIQAACDFAQPKVAPIPFLLASVIPGDTKNGKLPGFVSPTPTLAPLDGLATTPLKLAIFRTVPHPLGRGTLKRGKFRVFARLRDQLVESIIHDHHSHGSRPGFISFY